MKSKVGLFATSGLALALSACGGGLQSPDFSAVLNGVVIEEVAPNTLTVDVGASLSLRAFGLYTLPPGSSGGEACGEFRCTRGDAPGVTWSVSGQDAVFATVDSTGTVRGIKRKPPTGTTGLGRVTVTARIGDLPSDDANVTVDGEVLQALVFTPSSLSGTTLLPVPVGIRQPLAVQAQYTVRGQFSQLGPVRDIISETINWSVNDTAFATVGTATGATNTLLGVRETVTPRPVLTVRATNVENDQVTAARDIVVTPPVLVGLASIRSDKDIIEVDEQLPVIALGRFSDGMDRELTRIEGGTTVSNDDIVSFSAAGTSTQGGLVAVVNADTGVVTGQAFGTTTITASFRDNVVRDGLAFSTTPATATKNLSVIDRVCAVQFVNPEATATTTSGTSADSCGVAGSCRTANPANSITGAPAFTDSANFQIASPGGLLPLGYTLDLSVNTATAVAASTAAPRRIGFVIGVPSNGDADVFNPAQDFVLSTLNGTTATELGSYSVVNLNTQVSGFSQMLIYADVTAPFTGLRAEVPVETGLPLFDALSGLLGGAGPSSFEVPVFQVCSLARLPVAP